MTTREDAGATVRRAVLGDEHVDRAAARTTELTAAFQQYVTAAAWGSIWTREGLGRRERSMITLALLAAGGHEEELALHLTAAPSNGVTTAEITEVLLHTAVYAGIPAVNTAFTVAQRVLEGLQEDAAVPT